jgi:hypothetical protein
MKIWNNSVKNIKYLTWCAWFKNEKGMEENHSHVQLTLNIITDFVRTPIHITHCALGDVRFAYRKLSSSF